MQYSLFMLNKGDLFISTGLIFMAELQKRANQLVLFFLAGANFWEKHAKKGENTRKQAKTRENRRKTGAFLVLIFLWEKLVGANFYAFCNYVKKLLVG